jgi:hypothetical protein
MAENIQNILYNEELINMYTPRNVIKTIRLRGKTRVALSM